MAARRPLPDEKILRHLFEADADRGVLIRKVTRAPNARAGALVGSVDGRGYLHVTIGKSIYRVHRIIFFLHYGYDPDTHIDHIDGDRLNNRPSNLRPATDQQNAGNVLRSFRHNTSGFRGVSRNSKTGKWHAQIKLFGKQTYLGRFDTPEEAARCYDAAARKHFGAFARLNHG